MASLARQLIAQQSMSGDHDLIGPGAASCRFHDDAPENAHLAPAKDATLNCLVKSVACRNVAPPETIADHENDAADDPSVIHPGHAVRPRKERRNPRHLVF